MVRKRLSGKIKSRSGSQTVAVGVVRVFHHLRYRKRVRASKTYLAHLEGEAAVGQSVAIEENRPISRRKRWVVVEVEGKPVGRSEEAQKREVKTEKSKRRRVRK